MVSLSRGDTTVHVPWAHREKLEAWRAPTISFWDTHTSRVLEVKSTGERMWRERTPDDDELERWVLNR